MYGCTNVNNHNSRQKDTSAWLIGHVNVVMLCQALLVLRWVTVHRFVTSHSGQLSFLPTVGDGQAVVAVLCGWEGLTITDWYICYSEIVQPRILRNP